MSGEAKTEETDKVKELEAAIAKLEAEKATAVQEQRTVRAWEIDNGTRDLLITYLASRGPIEADLLKLLMNAQPVFVDEEDPKKVTPINRAAKRKAASVAKKKKKTPRKKTTRKKR